MATVSRNSSPAGPIFTTPLTVHNYAHNKRSRSNNHTTSSSGRSEQQQPSSSQQRQQVTDPRSRRSLPASPTESSTSCRRDSGYAYTFSETRAARKSSHGRGTTLAERTHRENVHRSYQDLLQCLILRGLIIDEDALALDMDMDETVCRVAKVQVFRTAVKAIDELRQQKRHQDEEIRRLESYVQAAHQLLQQADLLGASAD